MALYRQIQVAFWQDGFVLDLTPEEKFFYIYLMTNSKSSQCGIFELPKKVIEMETGFNRETIDKLLSRFVGYKKILYCEKTKEVMILNWIKYNFINSRNTIMCINKELKEIKNKEFVLRLYEICEKLKYPLIKIFYEIPIEQYKIMTLEATYKDLGEEEIKEEELIKEKEEAVEEVIEEETPEIIKHRLAAADTRNNRFYSRYNSLKHTVLDFMLIWKKACNTHKKFRIKILKSILT